MAARKSTHVLRSPKSLPVRELTESVKRLEVVLAIITVAAAALQLQGAEMGAEAATALRRGAADPLGREIEQLSAFIAALKP